MIRQQKDQHLQKLRKLARIRKPNLKCLIGCGRKAQHSQKLRELAPIRKQPGMLGCGALSFYFVISVSVTPITLYYCEKLRNWTEPHF